MILHLARISAALLALVSAPAPGDAHVSLFSASGGSAGDVLVVPEAGGPAAVTPAGLGGIELLPIEVAGRTRVETFLPDRARRVEDVAGASRLELPAEGGSLYRFRRVEAEGAVFGFFAVAEDGTASVLFERLGHGPTSDLDPFVDRVAIPPSGDAFLAATLPQAGGELFEIGLDGSVQERAGGLAPMTFSGSGLRLQSTWGVGAGPDGIVRFVRADPGPGAELALPGDPAWLGGEIAVSPGGERAVTTAGPAPGEAFVFAFGPTGAAVQATLVPRTLSPAGYLPEHEGGPFLAIDDAGSSVGFRTEDLVSREAWFARIQSASVQLTSDELYLNTLDQAGVMRYQGGKLLLAVGELADEPGEGGIENLDVYTVDPEGSSSAAITNLSQSNGLEAPPFDVASDLDPEDGMYDVPGTDRIVLHDSESGSGRLIALDKTDPLPAVLLDDVKSMDLFEVAGDHVLLSLRRRLADDDLRQLVRLDKATLTPTVLASFPDDEIEFERAATRPDGVVGLVVRLGLDEWLARVDLEAGTGELFLALPLAYGPSVAFAPSGALTFTAGVPGFLGWPVAWDPAAQPPAAHALAPSPTGQVLPGR